MNLTSINGAVLLVAITLALAIVLAAYLARDTQPQPEPEPAPTQRPEVVRYVGPIGYICNGCHAHVHEVIDRDHCARLFDLLTTWECPSCTHTLQQLDAEVTQ